MDRLLRDPPGDIPKRNIDGREAVHKSAATPEDMEFLLQIEAALRPDRYIRGQVWNR
jgi:hypothetical protein